MQPCPYLHLYLHCLLLPKLNYYSVIVGAFGTEKFLKVNHALNGDFHLAFCVVFHLNVDLLPENHMRLLVCS